MNIESLEPKQPLTAVPFAPLEQQVGAFVSPIGDFNDDGFDDAVVTSRDVAWLHFGSENGLSDEPAHAIALRFQHFPFDEMWLFEPERTGLLEPPRAFEDPKRQGILIDYEGFLSRWKPGSAGIYVDQFGEEQIREDDFFDWDQTLEEPDWSPWGDFDGNGLVDVVHHDQAVIEYAVDFFFSDIDEDNEVGFSDFLVLSANFGREGDRSDGDLDGDGRIAFSDFLFLSSSFGVKRVA